MNVCPISFFFFFFIALIILSAYLCNGSLKLELVLWHDDWGLICLLGCVFWMVCLALGAIYRSSKRRVAALCSYQRWFFFSIFNFKLKFSHFCHWFCMWYIELTQKLDSPHPLERWGMCLDDQISCIVTNMLKIRPLKKKKANMLKLMQFLGRGKDDGVRRSAVSGKKVLTIVFSITSMVMSEWCKYFCLIFLWNYTWIDRRGTPRITCQLQGFYCEIHHRSVILS